MSGRLTPAALERWRSDPAAFIEECLFDPETGKPFTLLPAERAFIAHAFKTGDDGRLLYPEQIYSCGKKGGKTHFNAMLTLTTILLFGGRNAEATICANDLEQSIGRVFQAVKSIVEASPMLKRESKVTAEKIAFPAIGATIAAIPHDFAGAAGGNPTISSFDELWAFRAERSRRLWDEMVPPPTRKIALRLTTTYAGFEGESTLLEELLKRGTAQPLVGKDLHAGDGILCFLTHEPIAPWQTQSWLQQMRQQLRANAFIRMIENRFVTTESVFVDMDWFDRCVDPTLRPELMGGAMMPVWIGVDASVKHDSSAVVAVTFDDKTKRVRLVNHRVFQPTPDKPLDFEATIESTIREFARRFSVRSVHYDPYQMAAVAQRLQASGIPMREYAQSVPNLTAMGSNLYELIKSGSLAVYPDDALRLAVSRTIALETPRGIRLAKEKSSHRIDSIIALAMASLHCVEQASRPEPSIGLGGKVFSSSGMVLSDSITPIFDRFKPPPPPPTANDVAHRENLKRQHEAMRLRIEGPQPSTSNEAVRKRMDELRAAWPAPGIGAMHSKLFGAGS
jgi:phage terminase large subunit-like protein